MDFYITATYVPATVLVFLSWCCFWISRAAVPARITLAVTTILSTILLHGTINASMPKVGRLGQSLFINCAAINS